MKFNVPKEILNIAEKLQKSRLPAGRQGFSAYLVGGCVRDLILSQKDLSRAEPKDWDIATDAKPDEIQKIFPDNVYENNFGTVGVKTNSKNPTLKIIEITTFRLEGKYSDKRHPDEIKFAKTIEEDLSRRDFTINALALSLAERMAREIIDPFGGQEDIKNKIIRTVGNPEERFNEDALRLMRAVRFAAELDFKIDNKTGDAIKKSAGLIEMIAKERIRDELQKILTARNAAKGIEALEEFGLLKYIVPELREGIRVGQNKHHIYTVWEHNLRALDYCASKNYSPEVRTASLFHDVGKPRTKRGDGPDSTFYGHDIVGAKMVLKILDRLHFSRQFIERTAHLVRYHLFYYNVGEVTASGVRRFISRVGAENIGDLIKVREADRIGSGVPKAVPYKLMHLLFMIDKVKRDPVSPKILKVTGNDVMRILKIIPGPRIGWTLSILLNEVIENPKENIKKNLELRIKNLGELSDKKLIKMAEEAKGKKDEFESGIEEEIKKKYYVK